MNKDLLEELLRIKLLSAKYKNKSRMCPLEIKREEVRSYILNEYIKELQQGLLDIKKYIKNKDLLNELNFMDIGTNKLFEDILDIVNKALGSDSNE